MVVWSSAVAACLCLFLPTAQATFLPTPAVRWTYQLPGGSRRLGRGNNVVASQDGSRVFSTTQDGSLHIVYTSALDYSSYFEPETFPETLTSCNSGVVLIENADTGRVEYAVYAVRDVTTADDIFDQGPGAQPFSATSSRLLAVNLDGTLRWSMRLAGTVVGKPIVGADQNTFYVVHNLEQGGGRISVVVVDPNGPVLTATLAGTNSVPFGPATGRTIEQQQGGGTVDIVVFGENVDNGLSEEGALYMLIPSDTNVELSGRGNDAYDLKLIFGFPRSAVARPAVSQDGTEVYLAQQESTLTGWNGRRELSGVIAGNQESVFPQWLARPSNALQNGLLPFPSAPILSADERFLYLAGASASVLCVNTANGNFEWSFVTGGVHAAEPVLSEIDGEDPVVYFIEVRT
jgi:hypothetical protein